MEREILFRGRQKGGKEWFEGDLSYLIHDKRECYIFPPDGYNSPDNYEVDPATVGQYTGLTDKTGKKIFEGDIIKSHRGPAFLVEYVDDISCFVARARENTIWTPSLNKGTMQGYEVVGNHWDNPELLV